MFILIMNRLFCYACEKGPLNVATWLFSVGDIDLHKSFLHRQGEYRFIYACSNSHLFITKWLWILIKIGNVDVNEKMNKFALAFQYKEMVDWLLEIHYLATIPLTLLFQGICCVGCVEPFLTFLDLHDNDDIAFLKACESVQYCI
jgi:hypothetical protein